jgi:hypothetical protein
MNEIITRIKNRKFLGAFFVALLVIVGIPLTILQVQKSSENRSRASGEEIAVKLDPLTKDVKVGDEFDVNVTLDAGQSDISAVDITFSYTGLSANWGAQQELQVFTPSSSFSTIVKDVNESAGTIHFVAVNPTQNKLTGASLPLGTLHFIAKTAGTAHVGFTNIHINAAGVADALPIDTTNTKEGVYTIGSSTAKSCTPGVNDCAADEQCATLNSSSQGVCVPTHCGGNTATAKQCPAGFSCENDGSAPVGDIGGTCIPLNSSPSVSPVPSGKSVTLYITVPGVGANNSAGLNNNPKRTIRTAYIKFYDSQNKEVSGASGPLTFQSSTGLYTGSIPVSVADGTYSATVRLDNSLWKRLAGIVTISGDTNVQTQPTTLILGDFNGDNEINLQDYNMLISELKKQ